jgi:predicted RNA binding protein YcfA (HicA-like mRNA interferase family)
VSKKTRRFTAREIEKLLKEFGFELVSQKGSHRKWRNPLTGRQVIVPMHAGRELPLGTARNILTNAEIPEKEWKG